MLASGHHAENAVPKRLGDGVGGWPDGAQRPQDGGRPRGGVVLAARAGPGRHVEGQGPRGGAAGGGAESSLASAADVAFELVAEPEDGVGVGGRVHIGGGGAAGAVGRADRAVGAAGGAQPIPERSERRGEGRAGGSAGLRAAEQVEEGETGLLEVFLGVAGGEAAAEEPADDAVGREAERVGARVELRHRVVRFLFFFRS